MSSGQLESVLAHFRELQDRVCDALEGADRPARFEIDDWQRPEGGGGRSRVLHDGAVFERAGVNFSHVHGPGLPSAATANRPALEGRSFQAVGVSVVVHPCNPHVPTTHCNVRYFVADKPPAPPVWWFGGGFDLTPYYGYEDDAVHWHRTAAEACDGFGPAVYPRFKRWCDEYFYLKHRAEPRGIGGLFFDDLCEWPFETAFAFVRGVGEAFLAGYLPIVGRRRDTPYGERERAFQLMRRGRYVEFNLVQDRGTLFGLETGGRAESILMSLPPLAAWRYDWRAEPGSPESDLYERFLRPRDWV